MSFISGEVKTGVCMGRSSSDLHLEIAEWILEYGDSVSVYDVVKRFDVTFRRLQGFFLPLKMMVQLKRKEEWLYPHNVFIMV